MNLRIEEIAHTKCFQFYQCIKWAINWISFSFNLFSRLNDARWCLKTLLWSVIKYYNKLNNMFELLWLRPPFTCVCIGIIFNRWIDESYRVCVVRLSDEHKCILYIYNFSVALYCVCYRKWQLIRLLPINYLLFISTYFRIKFYDPCQLYGWE